ncbi:MAG: hypothetical protein AAB518_03445 [Patescibacteria group bacterium]
MRQKTGDRLARTCFRGYEICCAGNFIRWSSLHELLEDLEVLEGLLHELQKAHCERDFSTQSIMIEYGAPIGWSSTAPRSEFEDSALEPFQPNRRSQVLRVRRSRKDLRSPLTDKITFVVEFKDENGMSTAVIHSIYPGDDVGELAGDITARRGVVFYDWNHPGA